MIKGRVCIPCYSSYDLTEWYSGTHKHPRFYYQFKPINLLCIIIPIVPFPILSLTPVNPPMLSEPLTLECQATVVRGITSRLDFTWVRMNDDSEVVLRTVVGANSTGDSLVYIDSYTTPFLNESDIDAVYFCVISLNDGGLEILMDSTNFTLDILSEYTYI